jgi:hypothetical protein
MCTPLRGPVKKALESPAGGGLLTAVSHEAGTAVVTLTAAVAGRCAAQGRGGIQDYKVLSIA